MEREKDKNKLIKFNKLRYKNILFIFMMIVAVLSVGCGKNNTSDKDSSEQVKNATEKEKTTEEKASKEETSEIRTIDCDEIVENKETETTEVKEVSNATSNFGKYDTILQKFKKTNSNSEIYITDMTRFINGVAWIDLYEVSEDTTPGVSSADVIQQQIYMVDEDGYVLNAIPEDWVDTNIGKDNLCDKVCLLDENTYFVSYDNDDSDGNDFYIVDTSGNKLLTMDDVKSSLNKYYDSSKISSVYASVDASAYGYNEPDELNIGAGFIKIVVSLNSFDYTGEMVGFLNYDGTWACEPNIKADEILCYGFGICVTKKRDESENWILEFLNLYTGEKVTSVVGYFNKVFFYNGMFRNEILTDFENDELIPESIKSWPIENLDKIEQIHDKTNCQDDLVLEYFENRYSEDYLEEYGEYYHNFLRFYDLNGNLILDLSNDYNVVNCSSFYKGYALLVIENDQGGLFYTVIDKQGNRMFEPVVYENAPRYDSEERGYVDWDNSNGYCIWLNTAGGIRIYDKNLNLKKKLNNSMELCMDGIIYTSLNTGYYVHDGTSNWYDSCMIPMDTNGKKLLYTEFMYLPEENDETE